MDNRQENNIKPFGFFALFASAIALIGGLGNTIYSGDWENAIAIAITGAMAVPTWIRLYKYTTK